MEASFPALFAQLSSMQLTVQSMPYYGPIPEIILRLVLCGCQGHLDQDLHKASSRAFKLEAFSVFLQYTGGGATEAAKD